MRLFVFVFCLFGNLWVRGGWLSHARSERGARMQRSPHCGGPLAMDWDVRAGFL